MRIYKLWIFIIIATTSFDVFACDNESKTLIPNKKSIECEIDQLPENLITGIPQNREYIAESLEYFFKFIANFSKSSFTISSNSTVEESVAVAKYLKENGFSNWESNKILLMPFDKMGNYTAMPFIVAGMYLPPNLDMIVGHFAEFHFNRDLYNTVIPYALKKNDFNFYMDSYFRIQPLPNFHKILISKLIQKLFKTFLNSKHIILVDEFYWKTGNNIDRELLLLHEISHAMDQESGPHHFWNENYREEDNNIATSYDYYKKQAIKIWEAGEFIPEKSLTMNYINDGFRVPNNKDREQMIDVLTRMLYFNSQYFKSESEITSFKNEMIYLMSEHNMRDCNSILNFYEKAKGRHLIKVPASKLFFKLPSYGEDLNSQVKNICESSLL